MAEVTLRNVVKAYGRHPAVKGINLDIPDKSFVALVGPSGCGKSTTLRMIAGLESISHGEVSIGADVVNDLPSRKRGVSMVFQSYALYPHMTVRRNLSFGLRINGVPKDEIDRRVAFAAEVLELAPYMDRKPANLSGGQRQRVAMGRAIVREPKVFLFDEPLSNLDAKLRNQMRVEIKKLHQRLKNTIVYVTHDQIEAMTMADIIVIMRDGRIEQVGAPLEVFEQPANRFVAGFIGAPQMNFFSARVQGDALHVEGLGRFHPPAGKFDLPADGGSVTLGLRPENIVPAGHGLQPTNAVDFQATVPLTESLGNETILFAEAAGVPFTARMQQPRDVAEGECLSFHADADRLHVFDPETEQSLLRQAEPELAA
ncbi:ABC transporter ATP-binding protein [Mameliella sediminis]|uniref:ABC transporter ATP-binding protein n=1 Tax=Mameliella sediminis TaxID=2836866 RepID=UPI001C4567B3|nr:sn-glycerol-3-phosphate ABC transporter ATP-binding protein UgpC [Mameliella sediminis]MBV7393470.1 sn-glycerol-3-phosphate ABC transporter ATP-binding protein UgpC [Mameliella sediminis]MBY6161130.1 sn-glycerol-3-phosphate ABC transporter ATP-binding protein UgpC [Mameliella alba]MBY6169600.1 sn-glycerol-3-phosphate ABC transporter ATP-binding protein UgpC [Mameliella alba]MBY6174619.1 sn-glycerol-3-phosphate ABC transporter ATP-binding protein UgpC [Mameliella alba]